MTAFLLVVVGFLLITVAGGLVRVVRGPTEADRMLATTLCGTAGCAIFLLLAEALATAAFVLVVAVLAWGLA